MSSTKKIFRDPIHSLIYFDKNEEKVLIDLINSREFQRLKRIKQLGFSYYTYPSAVHDRFSHSLGVAHLTGLIFDKLNIDETITFEDELGNHSIEKKDLRLLLRIAALLHDIGHGPFSHVFEKITKTNHEIITQKIIGSDEFSIKSILNNIDNDNLKENIVSWVQSIINKTFNINWAKDIISSQLDADRMDYLMRDAYMCGVSYVSFDWEWIVNNMRIEEIPQEKRKGLVIDFKKGIYSLESFIISRSHMYEQVYFHKTTRCAEAMSRKLLQRIKEIVEAGEEKKLGYIDDNLLIFLKNNRNLSAFINLDDFYMLTHFNIWIEKSKDKIVQELSQSLFERKLYKMVKEVEGEDYFNREDLNKIKKIFPSGDEEEYKLLEDNYINNPYKDAYLLGSDTHDSVEHIWLFDSNKSSIIELAEKSSIINSLRNKVKKLNRVYLPEKEAKLFLN